MARCTLELSKSRRWLETNRKQLQKKFVNKTIIVSIDKVIKVFDGAVDPLQLNAEMRKLRIRDWSYTYFPPDEEAYLL